MPDLSTKYMGLNLKNPIIVGSSTLTDDPLKSIELEQKGAAAVVLKSLFEQEVRNSSSSECCNFHPEAYYYDFNDAAMQYGISDYINLVKTTKSAISIPVIASICCETDKWWKDYPLKIQDAGADALEVNISMLSFDANEHPSDSMAKTMDIIRSIKERLEIPLAVKISPYCCSIPYLVKSIENIGADAAVMFSRFFKIGINLETLDCEPADYYSSPAETYKVLRWVGVVAKQVDMDISSITGIHSSNEVIQHILSGASTVQMVSAIYKEGPSVITRALEELENYMQKKQFDNLDEMKGFIFTKNERPDFDMIYFNSIAQDRYQLDSKFAY
jgi:dihydroorotate dehydrogenase (fumarate)